MKYIIPEIPPSNNRYIGRTNYREYQKTKKYWENLIYISCTPRPKKPMEKVKITFTYYFKDRKRRDPDNYAGKMVLDGLVKAGIIADDCFENIDLILKGKYDRLRPRMEISIEKMGTSKHKKGGNN